MAYDERALQGIGGWPAFLIALLGIVQPLWFLLDAVLLWQDASTPVADRWAMTMAGAVRLAIMLLVAWRLYAVHRPETLRIAIPALWAGTMGVTVLESSILYLIGDPPDAETLATDATLLAQDALFAAIWTLYLRRSRRVANTYAPRYNVADVFG